MRRLYVPARYLPHDPRGAFAFRSLSSVDGDIVVPCTALTEPYESFLAST